VNQQEAFLLLVALRRPAYGDLHVFHRVLAMVPLRIWHPRIDWGFCSWSFIVLPLRDIDDTSLMRIQLGELNRFPRLAQLNCSNVTSTLASWQFPSCNARSSTLQHQEFH